MCVLTYVSVYIYVCGSIRVSIIASYLIAYFEYTGSQFIFVHTVPGGITGQPEGRVEETIYLQMNLVRYIFARADGKVAQRI